MMRVLIRQSGESLICDECGREALVLISFDADESIGFFSRNICVDCLETALNEIHGALKEVSYDYFEKRQIEEEKE